MAVIARRVDGIVRPGDSPASCTWVAAGPGRMSLELTTAGGADR
jgi:hypothetical protein